jgi:hypothetical protein
MHSTGSTQLQLPARRLVARRPRRARRRRAACSVAAAPSWPQRRRPRRVSGPASAPRALVAMALLGRFQSRMCRHRRRRLPASMSRPPLPRSYRMTRRRGRSRRDRPPYRCRRRWRRRGHRRRRALRVPTRPGRQHPLRCEAWMPPAASSARLPRRGAVRRWRGTSHSGAPALCLPARAGAQGRSEQPRRRTGSLTPSPVTAMLRLLGGRLTGPPPHQLARPRWCLRRQQPRGTTDPVPARPGVGVRGWGRPPRPHARRPDAAVRRVCQVGLAPRCGRRFWRLVGTAQAQRCPRPRRRRRLRHRYRCTPPVTLTACLNLPPCPPPSSARRARRYLLSCMRRS